MGKHGSSRSIIRRKPILIISIFVSLFLIVGGSVIFYFHLKNSQYPTNGPQSTGADSSVVSSASFSLKDVYMTCNGTQGSDEFLNYKENSAETANPYISYILSGGNASALSCLVNTMHIPNDVGNKMINTHSTDGIQTSTVGNFKLTWKILSGGALILTIE